MNKISKVKIKQKVDLFKYIFFLIVICVVVALVWSNKAGNKQDEQLLSDYTLFQKIADKEVDEENFDSIEQLSILQQKYSDEYLVAYQLGVTHLNDGNMPQALTMYSRTLDLNPYIIENAEFMYQYALVLVNNEQIDNAKLVIERAQQLGADEEYHTRLSNLLESIDQN